MIKRNEDQLLAMLSDCQGLGDTLCAVPERGYFAVIAPIAWGDTAALTKAKKIQSEVNKLSKQYPNVVCYCFEDDCTLVYVI